MYFKRTPDIVVLSDVHLGTYGSHVVELLNYLKSIQPQTLILNGDIIDVWNFKKSYFPKEHLEVLRRIMKMSLNGTKVYYLTGNHDDLLRKFSDMSFGQIHLRNKLVFSIGGNTHWVFHGDVFDSSIHRAKWLARLGGQGYDLLIRINRTINWTRNLLGLGPVSFSAKVKKKVKGAVKYISDFEQIAVDLAAEKGYDYVICGHIHLPQIRICEGKNGKKVTYLNSGDWVEHLTALECRSGEWQLYTYDASDYELVNPKLKVKHKSDRQTPASTPDDFVPLPAQTVAFDQV
jgi:UDP-2,3-diacylglucosamine pyrophosphatase LpxH